MGAVRACKFTAGCLFLSQFLCRCFRSLWNTRHSHRPCTFLPLTSLLTVELLPIPWFCRSYPLCLLILLELGFFSRSTSKIYFQKVWCVRKFCCIICKAARGMRHQLFARIFLSDRPRTWINLFRAVKSRVLGTWPARAHPSTPSQGAGQAWRLWPGPTKCLEPRWHHGDGSRLRSSWEAEPQAGVRIRFSSHRAGLQQQGQGQKAVHTLRSRPRGSMVGQGQGSALLRQHSLKVPGRGWRSLAELK